MKTIAACGTLAFTLLTAVLAQAAEGPPAVPAPPREFRAAWVATVANIDWPSRRGLTTEAQQQELLAILDRCVELNLNAVIFHVRPSADALYKSSLEPWSEYLSGQMGVGPTPEYDPLEFVVRESHARGLQLHAWFNPYRVRHEDSQAAPAAANHASQADTEIVRTYGKYLWFDPGEPAAVDRFLAVVHDVVERYDVDGIHIDDYFYPYPINDAAGKPVPFPDDKSYQRAVAAGEKLDRDDWRRQNVDRLIERMYVETKKTKPWVLVGVSPFGIWRPGHPKGVVGFDQYSSLYADARKWLREGWVDYFTPQLYWKVESKGQSYPKLLAWWCEENVKQRHIWPGLFTSRVVSVNEGEKREEGQWRAQDILNQIEATRKQPGATGQVHFSMKALMKDPDGIVEALEKGPYAEAAVVPATTWLGGGAPWKPQVTAKRSSDGVEVSMITLGGVQTSQWVVRLRIGDEWRLAVVPGLTSSHVFPIGAGETPQEVAVSAVSRLGQEGPLARTAIDAN